MSNSTDKKERKTERLEIRLTKSKKEAIKKYCKENNITMSVFIDTAIEIMLFEDWLKKCRRFMGSTTNP